MEQVQTRSPAKVNEVINFMDSFSPDRISKLKTQFPEHKNILKGGILQGEETVYPFSDLLVKGSICLEGMDEVINQCSAKKPKIRHRLKNLVNVQLVTQIIIAISGASIVTTLSNKLNNNLSIYAGILAFIGALLTIYIQFKTGILGQNSKNVFQLYDVLVTNNLKAESSKKDLVFLLKINNSNTYNDLDELIKNCNNLCFETRRVLEDFE
jgi:hypothetical protein